MVWKRMSCGAPASWVTNVYCWMLRRCSHRQNRWSLTHTQMVIHPYCSVSQHHAGVGPLTTRGRLRQRTHTCQNSRRAFSRANLDVGMGGWGGAFNKKHILEYTVKPNMTHHPLQSSPDTEHRSLGLLFDLVPTGWRIPARSLWGGKMCIDGSS